MQILEITHSKRIQLILDEADQLMDMGFREEIEEIGGYLPEKRQTFMFSATISRAIASVANSVLAPGYKAVDTVPKNDVPTHLKTQQSQIVVPYSQQPALMYSIIKKHQEEHPAAKIIVFFPTTKVVGYLARVFGELPGMDVLELHSKLTQMQRQRISERFRRAYSSILFTSDVSARGVDYPGVTLVLQVGVPSSKDQYIHRIGRTGRAGKSGEGILILSPYERAFLQQMSDLPLKEEFRFDSEALSKDEELQTQIQTAYRRAPKYIGEECYLSFLGYSGFL